MFHNYIVRNNYLKINPNNKDADITSIASLKPFLESFSNSSVISYKHRFFTAQHDTQKWEMDRRHTFTTIAYPFPEVSCNGGYLLI